MKLAIVLSIIVPTIAYLIIRRIQLTDFSFDREDNKNKRDIFDFDFYNEDYKTYIFQWRDTKIKFENFTAHNYCAFNKIYKSLKEIAEKRPQLFKEMYYTLDNMIHHLKYIYEEDNNNFVAEVDKHIKELLQPIINNIREEDELAEEELQKERQKIIDKEKEDYDFKFNACKKLWLDKMELGNTGEDEDYSVKDIIQPLKEKEVPSAKTKIAKNNLDDEINYYLDKVYKPVSTCIIEKYYNDKLDFYVKISKSDNEKINLLNKLKNEIRQNYADGICTHDIMIKYENKIDKEIKYIYDKAKIRMASNKLDELLDSIETRIGGR